MNAVARHRIAFVAIPKAACGSLKHLFFELESGTGFTLIRANGKSCNIHDFCPSRYHARGHRPKHYEDHFRFVILREPLKRFLSCYSSRVLHYRNLARWVLSGQAIEAGASPDPDLSGFVARLELHREWSLSIRRHTDPASAVTGPDLSCFDAVYPVERIDECAARLSALCGRPVMIPHRQEGRWKISVADLTASELAKIVDFCEADDKLMAGYTPPELPADAATCAASPPAQHQKRADT